MLRKNIHFLYGGGIGILLVAAVIIFNQYQNSQPQEPIKIYKSTVPSQQVPEKVEPAASPEIEAQPELNTVDDPSIKEAWDTEMEESIGVSEEEEFTKPTESLPSTEPQEPLQDDPKVVLLKEVFPEFDRLLREGQELLKDIQEGGGWTTENYAAFEARGKALEAEFNDYCQRIAEKFTGAVTFVIFDGQEWAYDVDFQVLQDSLEEPVPAEFDEYFQYTRLREMLGLPEIPPDFPLKDQMQFITR
ncbi:MAG: hypothetical protein OXL96_11895 [Candidatus Poribacteria bacterium]|nr:hypothetical protein [Candidatus Poribacteria bacterium]